MDENFITEVYIAPDKHRQMYVISIGCKRRKHIAITGKNGSGKTLLLRALSKALQDVFAEFDIEGACNKKRTCRFQKHFIQAGSEKHTMEDIENDSFNPLANFPAVRVKIKNVNLAKQKYGKGAFILAYYKAGREYRAQNAERIEKVTFQERYTIAEEPGKELVKYLLDLKASEALAKTAGKQDRADQIGEWFRRFEALLKKIFADPALRLDFDIETFAFRIVQSEKKVFSFDTLSSGYAAIFSIIADLLMRMEKKAKNFYDLEGIVLVDEIEAHLHLELQKNIVPLLIQIFPNIQFIFTTHSPFVLNSIANVVIFDLEKHLLVQGDIGLKNLPYEGIVEGYFNASSLSDELKEKYERYKDLAQKKKLQDEDYRELAALELYLDEIPDYLALGIMADYQNLKLDLLSRIEK